MMKTWRCSGSIVPLVIFELHPLPRGARGTRAGSIPVWLALPLLILINSYALINRYVPILLHNRVNRMRLGLGCPDGLRCPVGTLGLPRLSLGSRDCPDMLQVRRIAGHAERHGN